MERANSKSGMLTLVTRQMASASRPWLAVVGFALLAALSAQVRIPLPGSPVPMTMQLLAVLLAGYFLAPTAAALAMLVYLAVGTAGLPVFAAGSAGLMGVTAGYLIGFVIAAWSVSLIRGRSRSLIRVVAAGAVGTALIFASGVLWQVTWFEVTFANAIGGGVLPFLPKAVVELAMAVTVVSISGGLSATVGVGRPK